MTELKTLRDIYKARKSPTGFVALGDLREEAIKWVKHIIEQHNLPHIDISPTSYQEGTTWQDYDGRILFIKHFFNITEEDLK